MHTTRAEVFGEDDGQELYEEDQLLLHLLGRLVRKSISLDIATGAKTKKRTSARDESSPEGVFPFRLLSSNLPLKAISLQPKPWFPRKIREPACEDNEAEAKQRKIEADSVAVDVRWVFRESQKQYAPFPDILHKNHRFVLQQLSESPTRAPPLLLTSSPHQRPLSPVCPSRLAHTPLVSRYPSCNHGNAKCLRLPNPELDDNKPNIIGLTRRQRKRRRGVLQRPPQKTSPCSGLGSAIQYPIVWSDYDLLRKDSCLHVRM